MVITWRRLLFSLLFVGLGLLALQIDIRPVLALKGQSFTVFEFLAPAAGWFLGPWFGAISVLGVKLVDLITRQQDFTLVNVIRLFPLAFAAFYLGSRSKLITLVPLAAIAAFLSHPVGREVWYYSLFWLVPIAAIPLKRHLFANALGATFTAHAVGGAAFIWAIDLPAKFWTNLIPIVAAERLVFAIGIYLTVLLVNGLLVVLLKTLPKRVSRFLTDGLVIQ